MPSLARFPLSLIHSILWFALISASLPFAPGATAAGDAFCGKVQGTILDANGGSVETADVTITSKSTGQKLKAEVNSNGFYSTPSIAPGVYTVRVEAKGFKVTQLEVTVQVGVISQGNITLEVGSETTTVMVEASAVAVNTDQVSVQGVLTTDQIKNLPISIKPVKRWENVSFQPQIAVYNLFNRQNYDSPARR
jgi:hypothetical protein